MCKSGAQCGCGGKPSGLPLIVLVAVALAACEGAAAVIAETLLAVLVTVGVLNLAAVVLFVCLIRRRPAGLYRPQGRAALPAGQPPALGASRPAAISTARRPIPVTAITIHHPEGENSERA